MNPLGYNEGPDIFFLDEPYDAPRGAGVAAEDRIQAQFETGAKTFGMALLLVASAGAGVIGLIIGAIAGHPGKGALIGAVGVPLIVKLTW